MRTSSLTRPRGFLQWSGVILLLVVIVAAMLAVSALFWGWILMLLLGICGVSWGYWKCCAIALLASFLLASLRGGTSR